MVILQIIRKDTNYRRNVQELEVNWTRTEEEGKECEISLHFNTLNRENR